MGKHKVTLLKMTQEALSARASSVRLLSLKRTYHLLSSLGVMKIYHCVDCYGRGLFMTALKLLAKVPLGFGQEISVDIQRS